MRFVPFLLAGTLLAAALNAAHAEPIVPRSDDEVVERLPGASGERAVERRLRRELAARPDDARLAAVVARRHLDQARALGDPRHAGLAMAALQRWSDPASAPDEVLLLQATLDQYLHDFDGATARLERLLARSPRQPQAWLTLATLRRVQGRYADSDEACAGLARWGTALHAGACRAENDALRGRFDTARASLQQLLTTPRLDGSTRGWLLTTLAELEERAGADAASDAAWRAALAADASPYAVLGWADHLIRRGSAAAALKLLADQPNSDAVLLRRAIAGRRAGAPSAAGDARDLRERFAQSAQRATASAAHGRESAMFALWVEADAPRAWTLARDNVRRQREPLDLLVLAQSAQARGDAAARREVVALVAELGLVDRRIEELL